MSLAKKYDIPLETVQRMVKDGVISCSAVRYEEVYDAYKKYKTVSPNKSDVQISYEIADQMNMSDTSVRKIIYLMKK